MQELGTSVFTMFRSALFVQKKGIILKAVILTLFLAGFWGRASAANTYYVDCNATDDNGSGLSAISAWKTLNKVNNTTLYAGDSILFKRGCTWRGQLTVASSGSAEGVITFADYGSGPPPVFNGSMLLSSGWSLNSVNVWSHSQSTQPDQVFFNGVRGTLGASTASITAANEWYWDSGSNTLYIYSTSDPAIIYGNPGIEVSSSSVVGVHVNGQSYITFKNIEATKAEYGFLIEGGSSHITCDTCLADWNYYDGIFVTDLGSDDFVATNVTSHDNQRDGISVYNGPANPTITGGSFYNNSSHYSCGVDITKNIAGGKITGVNSYNNFYGIKLADVSVTNVHIEKNTVHDSANFGIDVDTGPTGTIIEYNVISNGGSHGLALEGTATQNAVVRYNRIYGHTHKNTDGIILNDVTGDTIYNNVIYGNAGGVLFINGAAGNSFYGNTIYNSSETGIDIEGSSTGNTLGNNIVDKAGYYLIYIDTTSTPGFISDYNDWSGSGWHWQSATYSSLADWQTNSAQDNHSLIEDPAFASASTNNFTLQSGSPAIDAGTNLGSSYAGGLAPSSTWPSSVTVLDQNSNGTAWEIGAYVYAAPANDAPAPPMSLSATAH